MEWGHFRHCCVDIALGTVFYIYSNCKLDLKTRSQWWPTGFVMFSHTKLSASSQPQGAIAKGMAADQTPTLSESRVKVQEVWPNSEEYVRDVSSLSAFEGYIVMVTTNHLIGHQDGNIHQIKCLRCMLPYYGAPSPATIQHFTEHPNSTSECRPGDKTLYLIREMGPDLTLCLEPLWDVEGCCMWG